MNTVYFIIQLFSLIWVITVCPMIITQLLRALIHDRSYSCTVIDLMTGVSAVALVLLGLPKF